MPSMIYKEALLVKISEYYKKAAGTCGKLMPHHKLAVNFFIRMGYREILDVGGNDGLWAGFAKSSCPEIVVDSADLSEELSARAQSITRSYNFDVTEPWPLPSESYDGVHLGAIVEHIFDYQTMFAECFRVLRPGGMFISTPNMAGLRHQTPRASSSWKNARVVYNFRTY